VRFDGGTASIGKMPVNNRIGLFNKIHAFLVIRWHILQQASAYFIVTINKTQNTFMAIDIKRNDKEFAAQLQNVAGKTFKYKDTLGITDAEIQALNNDAAAFNYIVGNQNIAQTFEQNFMTYKTLLRKGGSGQLGAYPKAPVFPTAPAAAVSPNLEGRFRAFVQRLRTHPSYTPAIGDDLGIEGAIETFVAREGKPKFFIELTSEGHPNLRWIKGKFEGVEIWKDDGKGFQKLDRDMKPDYPDMSPLPAEGTYVVWRYKMIYLIDDKLIGNWSEVVSVTVYGV
jgi:hypothetical protein